MFRRLWSGLPQDPEFPADLKQLGYYVNDDDEIRSIEALDYYVKYFISKNERYNERKRHSVQLAVEEIVTSRLTTLGLAKILLPLGTTNPSQPHLPIMASADLQAAKPSHVVLVFGETFQDFGIIAQRTVGGLGGIDKGSMVNFVKLVRSSSDCSSSSPSPPGVVLANTGSTIWSPLHNRAFTQVGAAGARMPSAVHGGMRIDESRNRIPANGNLKEHIRYMFEAVVPAVVPPEARLQVVAIGDAGDAVQEYLDWGPTWGGVGQRMAALALMQPFRKVEDVRCEGYRRFLREKTRAWCVGHTPLNTLLSGPDGNPNTIIFTETGCPLFSSGESHYSERIFVRTAETVANWFREIIAVERGPGTQEYRNSAYPQEEVAFRDPDHGNADDVWGGDGKAWDEAEVRKDEDGGKVMECVEVETGEVIKGDGGLGEDNEVEKTGVDTTKHE